MSPNLIDLFDCDSQTIECSRKHLTGLIRCLCPLNIRGSRATHRGLYTSSFSTEPHAWSKAVLMPFLRCLMFLCWNSFCAVPSTPSILSTLMREQPVKPLHPSSIHPSVIRQFHRAWPSLYPAIPEAGQSRQVHLCCGCSVRYHIWPECGCCSVFWEFEWHFWVDLQVPFQSCCQQLPCSAQTLRSSDEGDEEPYHCGISCWSYLSSSAMTFQVLASHFQISDMGSLLQDLGNVCRACQVNEWDFQSFKSKRFF